jgi:hypothetical protein
MIDKRQLAVRPPQSVERRRNKTARPKLQRIGGCDRPSFYL